ncbi:alpha/beta fold hydrolase [Segetibacter aerophilus]|uniref:alpha/beta fold hydrolase n=1 Tax=Segetibacter aerophilus TaxID=670293 RepID=UPI0011BE5973|nr:alpha/beta hydrolase [Segetibacter aerophilus]
MEKKIYRVLKYVLLFFCILFLYKAFVPRSYSSPPLWRRAGTLFWKLSTGSRIGYTLLRAKGPRIKQPIIYLHGGPGGHIREEGIDVLRRLSENGYNVYLYDQVGSGQSDRLKNIKEYTVERHVRDLREIISRTGSQKVILIGQSWGAILAVSFVAKYPALVDKLILTCPGPIFPVRQELANIPAPDSFHLKDPLFTNAMGNKKLRNLRTDVVKLLATTFHIKLATDREADMFQTALDYEVDKSAVCDTNKFLKAEAGSGFYAQIMTFKDLQKTRDFRSKLQNLAIPVLVMKGQCDNQKWGFTKEYLDIFPNHQLVIVPNAGHFISVEQPEVYIKTIVKFLDH